MSSRSVNLQYFIALALIVPVALLLGALLADPTSPQSIMVVGAVVLTISAPLVLRWHHPLTILLVNAPLNAFFLPGQPDLWIVLGGASLGISIVARGLGDQTPRCWTTSTAMPLLALAAVIILTAALTGGVSGRSLGAEGWGGKRYLRVLGAILVFFAIAARPVNLSQVTQIASGYFLSGVVAVVSNLVYLAGPSFFFLYTVFSVDLAIFQLKGSEIQRYTGLTWATLAGIYFMLARFGIRGVASHPGRLAIFLALIGLGLFGGFRSTLIMVVMVLAFQFFFERLYRGRYILLLVGALTIAMVTLVAVGDRLPLSFQRSISFLPVELDPVAKRDAASTLEWRVEMWKVVVKEIPQYFWLGKGFTFSGTDFYLTRLAVQQGRYTAYEDTLVSGNYHQGLLTIIIPFGIFGLVAFFWFVGAGWWILFQNARRSRPQLQSINTFILSYYSARLVFYIFLYGQFDTEFVVFTSCVALSLAINRGWQGTHSVAESKELARVAEKG
jgi:O-antigen ligase